jgi:hypothetical protein
VPVLAVPPARTVVLGHAIAGVALGARRTALTARLGKGVVMSSGKGSYGPFVVVRYARPALTVTFVQGAAETLSTSSTAYVTPQGVAVGSPEARMRTAYGKALHCGNFQICTLGKALPGHALTTFNLQNARVSRIDITAVLD